MENLIARLSRTGFLVLIGIVLIIGVGLGFVYFQQGAKQGDLVEKIRQMDMVLGKELSSAEDLRAEYDDVNLVLAPRAVPDALEMLVDIARESGIDVSEFVCHSKLSPAQCVGDVFACFAEHCQFEIVDCNGAAAGNESNEFTVYEVDK